MTEEKYQYLKKYLKRLGMVAIAYSAGVDSSFLLHTAVQVSGRENVLAITAESPLFPKRELAEAKKFCTDAGIKQVFFDTDELKKEEFCNNPPERCYICKKAMFEKMKEIAAVHGIKNVAEGSNQDDLGDYRPGLRAIRELQIVSPLREAGLTKAEIRELSRAAGLDTWNKPSYACLASRFAYGERITKERLKMAEQAEEYLRSQGFEKMRVRIHGTGKNTLARIELQPEDFPRMNEEIFRKGVTERLKDIGFTYVTVDLYGYRTGSMNESLTETYI